MPLYIKDEAINEMAVKFQKTIHAPSKTDAVREALQRALAFEQAKPGLADIAAGLCRNLGAKADRTKTEVADKPFRDSLYEG